MHYARVLLVSVLLTLCHEVVGFLPPSLAAIAAAAAISLSPAHVSCVPSPDDFDYSCQQSAQGVRQVLWRTGRPLVITQAWGEGTTSTGASMWPSAVALSQYMSDQGAEWWTGKDVLELGAGLSLNGLTAEALGARSVTVTDGDAAVLELAKANFGFNFPGRTNWRTEVLRFGEDGDAATVAASRRPRGARSPAATTFDVIVGSDLTYKRAGWPAFVGSVKAFSAPGTTTVLYATTARYRSEFKDLTAQFEAAGFEVQELAVQSHDQSARWRPGAPASPGGVLTSDVRILRLDARPAAAVADDAGSVGAASAL